MVCKRCRRSTDAPEHVARCIECRKGAYAVVPSLREHWETLWTNALFYLAMLVILLVLTSLGWPFWEPR